MENDKKLMQDLFTSFSSIRYVAIYYRAKLVTQQKSFVENSSSSDSDRYEELLVNPALLTLARQRGNIDCGGLRYLIVAYGNFFQVVKEIPEGHLSICLAPNVNPSTEADQIFHFLCEEYPSVMQHQF